MLRQCVALDPIQAGTILNGFVGLSELTERIATVVGWPKYLVIWAGHPVLAINVLYASPLGAKISPNEV